MKTIRALVLIGVTFLVVNNNALSQVGYGDNNPYANSPNNYANSPNNYANSPNNYENAPNNYENNPYNTNSNRIIRDNDGQATGYAVPRADGGVNYFNSNGGRSGYRGPSR